MVLIQPSLQTDTPACILCGLNKTTGLHTLYLLHIYIIVSQETLRDRGLELVDCVRVWVRPCVTTVQRLAAVRRGSDGTAVMGRLVPPSLLALNVLRQLQDSPHCTDCTLVTQMSPHRRQTEDTRHVWGERESVQSAHKGQAFKLVSPSGFTQSLVSQNWGKVKNEISTRKKRLSKLKWSRSTLRLFYTMSLGTTN